MQTRQYQNNAIDNAIRDLEARQSAVIVCATGLGKTVVFCNIAGKYCHQGRVLILAHREELITQAMDKVRQINGIEPGIFTGTKKRNVSARIIAASVLSIVNHLDKFNPLDFSLIIVDEAHHTCSDSYKKIIDHFKRSNSRIRILGVTATPERADKQALGQVYKKVSTDYGIRQATKDGWLVPVVSRQVSLPGFDLKETSRSGDDFSGSSLDRLLSNDENLIPLVNESIRIANGRKKIIVFAAGVKEAKAINDRINRKGNAGLSGFVYEKTPISERRQILNDFQNGKIRWLVNVGILTEGYDCPAVDCIVMARPTMSRGLYLQMIGRGLRPVTLLDEQMQPEGRKNAIKSSSKPNCLVIDFTDNTENNKIINATDIFSGLMEKPKTGLENSSGGLMLRESNRDMWQGHGFRKFTFTGYAVRGFKNKTQISPRKIIALSNIFGTIKQLFGMK